MAFWRTLGHLRVGGRHHSPRQRKSTCRLLLEPLEQRQVFSSADGNGPVLTAITSTPGSRSLVLTFDGPVLSSTATDLSNYRITAPNGGNPQVVTSSGPPVRVVAAQYGDISTTSSQVTLTLARPLQQGIFYRIFLNGELPITSGNPASKKLRFEEFAKALRALAGRGGIDDRGPNSRSSLIFRLSLAWAGGVGWRRRGGRLC